MAGRGCPVTHFDTLDQELRFGDVELFAAIRADGGIAWTEDNGGLWVVADFDMCKEIAADHTRFTSGEGVRFPPRGGPKIVALEFDRPTHTTHRKYLAEAVGARAVRGLEPMVRAHARRLLEPAQSTSTFDLSQGLAFPMPLDVIFSIVGATDDLKDEVEALTETMFLYRKPVEAGEGDPVDRLMSVFERLIALKLEQPGDDWLSTVVHHVRDPESELDESEVQGSIFALLFGGHHSTARGIACLVARIVEQPDLQRALRADPTLLGPAIEESLRVSTPLRWFARTAAEDVRVGGQQIRAGEHVYLLYAGANLDPCHYDDPGEFRLDRPRGSDHLAFGWGVHRCAGLPLAQLEMRVAIEEIFAVAPWIQLDGEIAWTSLVEPRSIPCRFTDAPAG